MRQDHCRIVAAGALRSGHALLEVDCTPLGQPARAGQFLMLRAGTDWTDPLRHPAFFSRGGQVGQLLLPACEPWTQGLATLVPDEAVDALGPLGQPFVLRPGAARLLVIARSEPLAPALAAAHWAQRQDCAVSLVLEQPQWQPLTDLVPDTVECVVGPPEAQTNLTESVQWADQVLLVAGEAHWDWAARLVERARMRLSPGFASVLVPSDFACGVGHCGACVHRAGKRQHTVCSDGPIFDLTELL
ncbi:MAG: hypothetical protein GXX93_13805 [Anaerolineae bacterium]|nr:hypothetical protein [Anaerolineae bacterium]